VVGAVGGVDMCLDRAVRDENSGANLPRGCQTLDGAEALAFVRQRKQEGARAPSAAPGTSRSSWPH
jgi:anionic cell wall polymer biosynthesis LytR-Cps2A-Psr (LCP) family protein